MTSAKNSSSRNGSASLKQGTLSFSSAKRTNSNTTAKTKKPPPPPAQRSSSALEKEKERADDAIHLERNDEGNSDDVLEMSLDEEHLPGRAIGSMRSRTAAGKSALPDTTKASAKRVKEDPPAVKPVEQRPSLDVTAKKYRKHYGQVREKMGNLEPIHAEGQNKIHEVLRVFDMTYEYGPCVGMTRLERWDRAASLGLKPPEEVRDILLTREGVDRDEYSQCVFYEEV